MSDVTITAIVLTYKRPDELDGILENLLAQRRPPDEILVFDNDPEGSGRQAARAADPRVRYVCSAENLGPAAGRNAAAREATGDLLFFLDDDCRLDGEDAVAKLPDCFAMAQVGCLAVLIRNAETRAIVPREFPGFHPERWPEPHDVTYFLAGAFAMPRALFEELGGFDAVLYHGEEEIELSFRIIGAGWRISYTPAIQVLHRASPQGRETIRRGYRLIRNRVYLALKHLPMPYLLTHFVLWGGFALLQALRAGQPGEFFRGLASLWQDRLIAKALAYRRAHPMTRETVAYLKKHEGRLIY